MNEKNYITEAYIMTKGRQNGPRNLSQKENIQSKRNKIT